MIKAIFNGRLGNNLYQYALLRILAETKNFKFNVNKGSFHPIRIYPDLYLGESTEDNISYQNFNEGVNKYNPEVFNINDNTCINGYWQSEKYFKGYENIIKNDWYNLNYDMQNKCVIHFRYQDDYITKNHTPNLSYFKNAINIVNKHKSNIEFIVVTDNTHKAKEYFPDFVIKKQSEKLDFKEIYEAKYKIISNSTFSWWASWLTLEKSDLIIAPNRWMNNRYSVLKQDTFYPYDIETEGFTYID